MVMWFFGKKKENRTPDFASFTDPGNRPVNEDSFGTFSDENGWLFTVCDGLGGHGMGDAASQCAVAYLKEWFEETSAEDRPAKLPKAFEGAQEAVTKAQKELKAGDKMKTTATALLLQDGKLYAGHVGDSRIYLFAGEKVLWRSKDHSVPQKLVEIGEIKESEIRHHPERSMLLKVIGIPWDKPQEDIAKPLPQTKADAFLLCSDGFWELITEEEMLECRREAADAKAWLEKMAARVLQNGTGTNMDNYTAIAGILK